MTFLFLVYWKIEKTMKPLQLARQHFFFQISIGIIFVFYLFVPLKATGQNNSSLKKSEPIYQNPFDLASGGASLTRATQEGVMFSNPSLPAFGEGHFRWIFLRSTFSVAEGTIKTGADLLKSTSSAGSTSSLINNAASDLFKYPNYIGLSNAAGVITSEFGIAGFAANKLFTNGKRFGTVGVPQLVVQDNGFAGVATTMSTAFGDHLAIGIGPKYIYNAEVNTTLSVNDVLNPSTASTKLSNALLTGNALATDIGFTLQQRTKNFDIRLAGVVADVGNTTFNSGLPPWLQTYNAGLGFAVHDFTNALHCAVDYRDITNVYGEDLPKKIYIGCKALITRIFGVGFGYLQGWPSYGFVLNLFLFRLEAGVYTRDIANQSGLVGQKVYFVSLGFEL